MKKYMMLFLLMPLVASAGGDPMLSKNLPQPYAKHGDSEKIVKTRTSHEEYTRQPEPDPGKPAQQPKSKLAALLLRCYCISGARD